MGQTRPIGVFDSGIGGLTVLAALRRRLPNEHFVYFGDTARVPYGIKSTLTVRRYSHQNAVFLRRFNPKLVCVACNTATAAGLDVVTDVVGVPVVGVVEPGSRRAVQDCPDGAIGIIATESTIASRCYYRAIRALRPQAELWEKACPLLVPMVEEGRDCDDPLVLAAVAEYLAPLRQRVGSLVLGCTHYPLLKDALARVMGPGVRLVDSAEEVAGEVARVLENQGALASDGPGTVTCYVSDNPDRFRAIGQRFMGTPLRDVTLVEPEEFFQGGQTGGF
ncbi:MAG TPA: glutamate racemase [Phycisphaerae bacterium]|nr:glutamate racemase [Phycisphaerae bacterium]HOI54469.1 glutamate racemase [Phycisphaerae bacterium]